MISCYSGALHHCRLRVLMFLQYVPYVYCIHLFMHLPNVTYRFHQVLRVAFQVAGVNARSLHAPIVPLVLRVAFQVAGASARSLHASLRPSIFYWFMFMEFKQLHFNCICTFTFAIIASTTVNIK